MFGTQMHGVTFGVLITQMTVLFTQLLFVLSRPNDTSRIRFLFLILGYMIFNLCSGFYPTANLTYDTLIPYIVCVVLEGAFCVYFLHYTCKEYGISFEHSPFYKVRTLAYLITGGFFVCFMLSYLLFKDIMLSRKLFLSLTIMISCLYCIQVGKRLFHNYKNQYRTTPPSKLQRYNLIAVGTALCSLAMLPVILMFANQQWIIISIVNTGFIAMATMYLITFVHQAVEESMLLEITNKREGHSNFSIAIPQLIVNDIERQLDLFEKNKEFLKPKVTTIVLAKRFGTNTKYLSKIIKLKKGKKFKPYINDLRIAYVKEHLAEDEQFRQYTLKAIAKEVGYNSAEGLAGAFFKKENIKLSEYIKKVRDNN